MFIFQISLCFLSPAQPPSAPLTLPSVPLVPQKTMFPISSMFLLHTSLLPPVSSGLSHVTMPSTAALKADR